MKNESLESYIINNNNYDPFIIDCIKIELQKKLYYYGNQFKNPSENNKTNYNYIFKDLIRKFLEFNNKVRIKHNSVISEGYFGFSNEIKNLGFNVYKTPWAWHSVKENIKPHIYTKDFFYKVHNIEKYINYSDFNNLFNDSISNMTYEILNLFIDIYKHKNIKALFLSQDMSFFQKLIIKAFKVNKKNSFIFLHGLPARYNNIDDNRTDYLLVWGEKIKSNYIENGVDKDKVFVVGHPMYDKLENKKLKFSFENITVITKAQSGAPIDSNDELLFQDRSRSLLYLYSIQNVLARFGVKKVKFRPHPSENISWYLQFLDKSFYIPDLDSLKDSLDSSTLLIGPMSTLLLESMYYGVNYLLYEPQDNNTSIFKEKIPNPFDGSDKNIPVAKNEDELYTILKERVLVNPDCFHDYIKTPFDIKFIKDLI